MKILISAGHTNDPNNDRGAAGNGYIEGVETLKIRDVVAAKLRGRGLDVIEDGSDGINDPLTKAIALAKTANIAIEFHFNAGPPAASGVEVLSKPDKRQLGQKLAKMIGGVLQIPCRGGDAGWKADNSGQHHRLGFCEAGGLIVEVAFITNHGDMSAYVANFDAMCDGIVEVLAGKPAEEFYTVVAGDTLFNIGQRFGKSVTDLMALNNLTATVLSVGQKLKVR